MLEGQNDYPLAKALKDMGGYPHHVKNWEDTRTRLSGVYGIISSVMPKGSHNSHSLLKEKLMTNIQRYRANDLAELFDKITKNR